MNNMKKYGIMAVALMALLAACSAAGVGDPDKEKSITEVNAPLTLNSLKAVFDGEDAATFNFDKTNSNYIVQTSEGKTGLVLSFEAPENVLVAVSPDKIESYVSDNFGTTLDDEIVVNLDALPIPRKDPDFIVAPYPAGVDDYMIVLTLSLKDDAPASTREGDTIYNWQPNTYSVYVKSPIVDIGSEENKQKVNDKITEAENKIQNLGMVVGNPADNDPSVENIVQLINDLNTLKRGVDATRTYETETQPEEGVQYTEREVDGKTVYDVIEVYPEYDYMAILTKAKQLNLALANSEVQNIITPKLQLSYKAAVQDVKIGSNGDYKIELVGGSGGHVWTGSNMTTTGGKGAKVTATFTLSAGQKLGFRTGGEGDGTVVVNASNEYVRRYSEKSGASWVFSGGDTEPVDYHGVSMQKQKAFRAEKPGGWPNGGSGGWTVYVGWAPGSGGGGSSDVRIYSGETLSNAFTYNNADPRILVAGGGGGAAQLSGGVAGSTKYTAVMGGTGGSINQGDGVAGYNGAILADTYFPKMGQAKEGGTSTYKGINGKPGVHANADTDNGVSSFPDFSATNQGGTGGYDGEGRAGGGGGFIGGEAIDAYHYKGASAHPITGSGAGGSNHVKSNAKSSSQAVSTQFGPGSAVIEWIQ